MSVWLVDDRDYLRPLCFIDNWTIMNFSCFVILTCTINDDFSSNAEVKQKIQICVVKLTFLGCAGQRKLHLFERHWSCCRWQVSRKFVCRGCTLVQNFLCATFEEAATTTRHEAESSSKSRRSGLHMRIIHRERSVRWVVGLLKNIRLMYVCATLSQLSFFRLFHIDALC